QARLARFQIDDIDRNVVFSASKNAFAFELDCAAGPIRLVDEPAFWMDVYRPRGLPAPVVMRIDQAAFSEQRFAAQRPVSQPLINLQPVVALQRNEDPASRWVEIEMPRLKPETSVGGDRRPVGQ